MAVKQTRSSYIWPNLKHKSFGDVCKDEHHFVVMCSGPSCLPDPAPAQLHFPRNQEQFAVPSPTGSTMKGGVESWGDHQLRAKHNNPIFQRFSIYIPSSL